MNILDENGESYFVTAFDHSTQEQGTATSKDAFTGGDINASLTQEVVELREEVTGHGTDQLLYLAGKDGGLVSNDLVDIAVFQDPGIERITLACDTVVEGNDTFLEALYHCQIRMAVAQLQDIDGKAANVNDIGDGMSFQRAELGNGSRKRLGIDELLQEEKCFSLKDLAVNGNDMMAIGLKGKSIGNALQACLDAVMDERVANDHTALLTLAQEQMIADTDQILSDFANDYKRMS